MQVYFTKTIEFPDGRNADIEFVAYFYCSGFDFECWGYSGIQSEYDLDSIDINGAVDKKDMDFIQNKIAAGDFIDDAWLALANA